MFRYDYWSERRVRIGGVDGMGMGIGMGKEMGKRRGSVMIAMGV